MQSLEATAATRLCDLAADALAFAVQLRRSAEPDPATLRAEVRRLFTELDAAAAAAGKDPTVVQSVRYALCAFLDEIVLSSAWQMRQEWASQPLQMEYFNDFTAGEEFYRKLDALRVGNDPVRKEAVEVFGLCLGLGFRGKFAGLAGLEELKALRSRVHLDLSGGSQAAQPLSLNWQVEAQLPQLVQRIPAWVFAASSAGVLLLLLLVLRVWLGVTEGSFLATGG
ncbi:MAG: DotU family type IV/VI secretion system protein [Planctomycetes bacterium]|nr:DotU family type IV/VI secretion system protein [Planctomycetota bacterium]